MKMVKCNYYSASKYTNNIWSEFNLWSPWSRYFRNAYFKYYFRPKFKYQLTKHISFSSSWSKNYESSFGNKI